MIVKLVFKGMILRKKANYYYLIYGCPDHVVTCVQNNRECGNMCLEHVATTVYGMSTARAFNFVGVERARYNRVFCQMYVEACAHSPQREEEYN